MTEPRGGLPPRLKDLLAGVGARIGLADTRATGAIWSRWTEIVGGSVAANAEPTSLRDGVLRIRAISPGWATELTYLVTEISQRANEVAGKEVVREVRIWTGPGEMTRPMMHEVTRTTGTAPEEGLDKSPDEAVRASPADLATALERARAAWARRTTKRDR
jgi:hypothetical protein